MININYEKLMSDKAVQALGLTLASGIGALVWKHKDEIIKALKNHVPDVDPMELGMKAFELYKSLKKG